jgi:hypothetical protein
MFSRAKRAFFSAHTWYVGPISGRRGVLDFLKYPLPRLLAFVLADVGLYRSHMALRGEQPAGEGLDLTRVRAFVDEVRGELGIADQPLQVRVHGRENKDALPSCFFSAGPMLLPGHWIMYVSPELVRMANADPRASSPSSSSSSLRRVKGKRTHNVHVDEEMWKFNVAHELSHGALRHAHNTKLRELGALCAQDTLIMTAALWMDRAVGALIVRSGGRPLPSGKLAVLSVLTTLVLRMRALYTDPNTSLYSSPTLDERVLSGWPHAWARQLDFRPERWHNELQADRLAATVQGGRLREGGVRLLLARRDAHLRVRGGGAGELIKPEHVRRNGDLMPYLWNSKSCHVCASLFLFFLFVRSTISVLSLSQSPTQHCPLESTSWRAWGAPPPPPPPTRRAPGPCWPPSVPSTPLTAQTRPCSASRSTAATTRTTPPPCLL